MALNAAGEMLGTTKNPTTKAQLIRTILEYDRRQKEYAATNKATNRKRSENKGPGGSLANAQALINQFDNKEVSDLKAQLKKVEQALGELQQRVTKAEHEAEAAHREAGDIQRRLKFINEITKQFASELPAEKRDKCASELFHKFKSDAPELLASLFESMGLDLKTWQSWERHYGENRELMVAAFVCPEKHEAGELSLLRLKLSALGIDVDAINAVNAVRDYRDLKINFAELEKRTRHQISFRHEFLGLRADSRIPTELMPRLTEDALREASREMKSDPTRKLEWLQVMEKLLKPDYGIGSLLLKEIASTRSVIEKF